MTAGQIAIFDVDQLARVLGDRGGLRDDHRDGLADVAHAAHREHRVERLADLLPVLARIVDDIGQRLEAGFARVLAREHGFDAGVRQGAARIEAKDFSVRAVGAQETRRAAGSGRFQSAV